MRNTLTILNEDDTKEETNMINYQLSGCRMSLADATNQGSVYVGELKIFRANSFVDAITMKLTRSSSSMTRMGNSILTG